MHIQTLTRPGMEWLALSSMHAETHESFDEKCRHDNVTLAESRTGMVVEGMTSGRRMIATRSIAEARREAPPIEPGRVVTTSSGDGCRPAIQTTGARRTRATRLRGRPTGAAAPVGSSTAAPGRGPRIRKQLASHPATAGPRMMTEAQGTAPPAQHATIARPTESGTTIAESTTRSETATGTATVAGVTGAQHRCKQTALDTARDTVLISKL